MNHSPQSFRSVLKVAIEVVITRRKKCLRPKLHCRRFYCRHNKIGVTLTRKAKETTFHVITGLDGDSNLIVSSNLVAQCNETMNKATNFLVDISLIKEENNYDDVQYWFDIQSSDQRNV